jgi:hypothetical protein
MDEHPYNELYLSCESGVCDYCLQIVYMKTIFFYDNIYFCF